MILKLSDDIQLPMEKINGIFSYEFNSSDKEGNYSLIYIYQNKPQNIKQYIYFIKDFKDMINISLNNSTHPCMIKNATKNIEVKVESKILYNYTNIVLYLIGNNTEFLLEYDNETDLFILKNEVFEKLNTGKYNINFYEVSNNIKYEMLSYNYTLTNVGYNSSYYYDNIFINMDCDPEQFEFFYSFPINNLSCEYINRSNNSGYKCNHKGEKNNYGNYTIKIFNKFNYYTFITKYLKEINITDIFVVHNESDFWLIIQDYYLPLIQYFFIKNDDVFDEIYTKDNFTTNETILTFQIENLTDANYYLENISDNSYTLNVSLNITDPKFSLDIKNDTFYIHKNNDSYTFTLNFKVNDNPKTPEDLRNIICYLKNDNNDKSKTKKFECKNITEGTVNCILSEIKGTEPLELVVEYNSPSKSLEYYKEITVNKYEITYYNCDINKRINLTIYNNGENETEIYEQNNDTLIDFKNDGYKLQFFGFINNKSNSIKIINSNNEQIIDLDNKYMYEDNNFTFTNQSIEIGRISQEINLIFSKDIEDYDMLENALNFSSKNDNKTIKEFNITKNKISFTFNVSKDYKNNSNEYYFSYINICERHINSNYFSLNNPEYQLINIHNTLVSPRNEEELFLKFLTPFSFKKISVTIGKDNEILLHTNDCSSASNNEIICKFNMKDFIYEDNIEYKLLNYEIETLEKKKKYDYSKKIEIIHESNTYCQVGILVSENNNCIFSDDIEQKVDISKQYNFCNNGKGYCMQDNEKKYYCNCKKNYDGLYCEYSNESQKMEKFNDTLKHLNNSGSRLNNNSLVLIKEIIYAINKTFITKDDMNSSFNYYLSEFVNNVFLFYSQENTNKIYFIYPFDLAFYIISLNKEHYSTDIINNITYLVNQLINDKKLKIKINKVNTGTLSNFKYSYYNEEDNYLPRFEYKNNKNLSNDDFNFAKLVIPHTIKNKNNESDVIFISVNPKEKKDFFTNIKFYFSSESVINKVNLDKYFKYKNYSYDIFKPDDKLFESCFIQKNESIFVDFPPDYIRNNISISKKINTNNKNCEYDEINNKGEIVIKCNSIIEKDLYVLLEDSVINNTNFSQFHFNCLNFSINLSTLYNNKMSFYSIIIILIYIIFIILIKIIDPIITGIKNDKLDESQHKIPEQTELSSIINDEDFDEEENVKVRQTRATFIELKKKESYFSIVLKNIIELHPLISSFRPNILTGMIYKFTMLLFNFFLLCSFNVFFYNENLLMKRATIWEEGDDVQSFLYPLKNEFLKIIISSLLSIPFIFLMGTTIELERKDLAKDFKKKIFIRKLIGFIFMILVSITSICYCTIFCFNYPRTQSCFLYSVIWSLIINWIILSPIHIFLVSHYQNNGNESKVYYMKRLNLFN